MFDFSRSFRFIRPNLLQSVNSLSLQSREDITPNAHRSHNKEVFCKSGAVAFHLLSLPRLFFFFFFLGTLSAFLTAGGALRPKILELGPFSVFSTRHSNPTSSLPLFSPYIPQAGIITFSSTPPPNPSPPACEAALLLPGLRSDRPSFRRAPKLVCHF